jgi:putative SOS response-associated peptidase YedK
MGLRLVIPSRTEVDGELSVACPWWQFSARFNVAISQSIPVARMHQRESEGVVMRWGLVGKSLGGAVKFTTDGVVRSESLQSSRELRMAWLSGQRGIVPLAGFYLWQRTPHGHFQPYYVRLVNRPVFGIAALWERVETDQDEVIESCALIAVHANPLLAELDNAAGQMPVILHREDYGRWLSCSIPQAQELLHPYPPIGMVCHAVGPYVNHLEFDEPLLIKPVDP